MQYTTLGNYLNSVFTNDPDLLGLSNIVLAIANSAIEIQEKVSTASLLGAIGSTGETNIQGETVQILDTLSSNTFVKSLTHCGHVAAIGCEEIEDIVVVGHNPDNSFVVQMDPLDGSSNIDVAISIGSIFGIWPNNNSDNPTDTLLRAGNEQIAALYTLYGTSTLLILATKGSVQGFTLNPDNRAFELTHQDICLPKKARYYSVNEGNFYRFDNNLQTTVTELKGELSLRYVGSLVADFHRNLLKGGIFLYPKDKKHPNGKLRLMYEANPLSFIIEQAGGMASSGEQRILDIQPETLHQRTPLIIGNKSTVDKALKMINSC